MADSHTALTCAPRPRLTPATAPESVEVSGVILGLTGERGQGRPHHGHSHGHGHRHLRPICPGHPGSPASCPRFPGHALHRHAHHQREHRSAHAAHGTLAPAPGGGAGAIAVQMGRRGPRPSAAQLGVVQPVPALHRLIRQDNTRGYEGHFFILFIVASPDQVERTGAISGEEGEAGGYGPGRRPVPQAPPPGNVSTPQGPGRPPRTHSALLPERGWTAAAPAGPAPRGPAAARRAPDPPAVTPAAPRGGLCGHSAHRPRFTDEETEPRRSRAARPRPPRWKPPSWRAGGGRGAVKGTPSATHGFHARTAPRAPDADADLAV